MGELSYRALSPVDADALHDIVSDWDVVRQLGSWPWPPDRAFTQSRSKPYDGNGFVWGIFRGRDLLGTVGVTEGELGYALKRSEWGKGIMTRAARRAVEHAFQDPKLRKITASTWGDNDASAHLLMKLSFSQLGEKVIHSKARGVPTLCYQHLLSRTHWDGLRSRGEWTIAAAEL